MLLSLLLNVDGYRYRVSSCPTHQNGWVKIMWGGMEGGGREKWQVLRSMMNLKALHRGFQFLQFGSLILSEFKVAGALYAYLPVLVARR